MVDIIIDASVGTATANSYLTEAEADAYFDGHFAPNPWLKSQVRLVLLVHSTRLLDQYMDWDGFRLNSEADQSLEWPRTGVLDVLHTIVPLRVKNAVCELASYLAINGVSEDFADVEKIRIGPITIDLTKDRLGFLLPPLVSRMLNHLGSAKLLPENTFSTVELVR